MIWLLVAGDAVAGAYLLLGWALRRERDKDAVLAVGVALLLCAVLLAGLGGWQLTQELPPPPTPNRPTVEV